LMYNVHRGKIWPKFCNSVISSHVDTGQVKLADRVTIGCPVCHLSGDMHNTVQILSVHCSKGFPSPLSRFQRFSFHSSAFESNACSVLGLYDIWSNIKGIYQPFKCDIRYTAWKNVLKENVDSKGDENVSTRNS
jgi:hypothetical protein